MHRQTSMAVLGLALALAIPVSAQTPTGTIRVHVSATVRVHVNAPETQVPIAGVQLSLVLPQNEEAVLDLPDNESDLLAYLQALAAARSRGAGNVPRPFADSNVLARAVTDSEGNAIFQGMKPGKYLVHATREGYVALSVNPTSVDVIGSATNVSMYLNPGTAISGRIQTADGKGAQGALITLGTIQLVNGQRAFIGVAGGRADADGVYRLPIVGQGEYALRVQLSPASGFSYYPGTPDLQKAVLLSIEAPRNLIEAGRNIVNVDVVLP